MPYLRITSAELDPERRRFVASRLTDAINDFFFHPRAGITRDELRERTTIHFTPYADQYLFIGGRTPRERGAQDVTVEISDWSMTVRQQRKLAHALTPILAELFEIPSSRLSGINIRFHSYPPTDFSVGGRLLSDIVPKIGRVMKRLFG